MPSSEHEFVVVYPLDDDGFPLDMGPIGARGFLAQKLELHVSLVAPLPHRITLARLCGPRGLLQRMLEESPALYIDGSSVDKPLQCYRELKLDVPRNLAWSEAGSAIEIADQVDGTFFMLNRLDHTAPWVPRPRPKRAGRQLSGIRIRRIERDDAST